MAMVSPSILSADFAHLGSDCRAVLDAGAAGGCMMSGFMTL